MKNCLIKKLKATVDNSNLPILEVMQQFTLDAIAASGNEVMTDDQKWALNIFFYKIGAINNSGPFSKLAYLFLPIICNNNGAKALVNYKDNVVIDADMPMSNGGVVSSSTKTRTTIAMSCTIPYANLSWGVLQEESVQVEVFRPDDTANVFGNAWNSTYSRIVVRASNLQARFGNQTSSATLIGATTNDGNIVAKAYKNNLILTNDVVSGTIISPAESYRLWLMLNEVPLKMIFYGATLTETELETMLLAMHELESAFI